MLIDYNEYKNLQKELQTLQGAWTEAVKDLSTIIGTKHTGTAGHSGHSAQEDKIKKISDDPVFKRLNAVSAFRYEH